MVVQIRVNDRGTRILLRKLRSAIPEISDAQREAGDKIGKRLRQEAYEIIREKAPKSSGKLANSLYVTQAARHGGWYTKLTTRSPYARVVERGGPPERTEVTRELKEWASRVNPQVEKVYRNKKYVVVRTGRNPNYNTATGMQFFQIPFNNNRDRIDDVYTDEIRKVLRELKMV